MSVLAETGELVGREWPRVALGEVLELKYGKALKADERDETGSAAVFGSSGQVGWHSASLTENETIILGRKGSVGAVTYAPKGGWPIDTTFFVVPKRADRLHIRFLYYALLVDKIRH